MASSHLKALLIKNFILWRRNWIFSILEIAIPALFSLLFLAFRTASPLVKFPEKSYSASPVPLFGQPSPLSILKSCNSTKNGGIVALAPPNDWIVTKLNAIFSSYNLDVQLFDSNSDINAFVTSSQYGRSLQNQICFGVVINENNGNGGYSYDLRFNDSYDIAKTTEGKRVDEVNVQNLISLNSYTSSGYLTLQNWIDNLILQHEVSNSSARIDASISSVTIPEFNGDEMLETYKAINLALVAIPLLLIYLRLVNGIMREKEKRIKEGMKIMGLKGSAFYISWLIKYILISFACSVLVSSILYATIFPRSDWILIFLWHFLFCLAIMAFGILLTVFFNSAKVANVVAFLFGFATGWPVSSIRQYKATNLQIFWASFLPGTSVVYGINHMLHLENVGLPLNTTTADYDIVNFKLTYHFLWCSIEFVAFLLLAAYFEQVMPSEFGIKKHPLFCLKRKNKPNRSAKVHNEYDLLLENSFLEAVDPILKTQDDRNESIKVQNLTKIYDNGKLAVNDVSFNMYKGQIFALLGHNGAGKTSTINMIIGLYGATLGTVKVFNEDINLDLDHIRKSLGVCPQHDVLFDYLTVQEHLDLYAVFKGVDAKDSKQEINTILEDLELISKRDCLAKDLSGGQKRKLSVALAFVGNPKFILLDEPSSGLDTSARRKLWEMLKNNKHGRVILLTTHYMDEADFLGDRIAIMGEGKIRCIGSPLFLKNKYGVGYNLTVVKEKNNYPSEPIVSLVKKIIPESKNTFDISAEIKFQLPTHTAGQFKQLFDTIDSNLKDLKISSYGVSVTTLEEVFLKVAENTASDVISTDRIIDSKETEFNLQKERITGGWPIFWNQFKAISKKRLQYIKRDKKGLFVELLIPVVLVVIGAVLNLDPIVEPVPLPVTDTYYKEVNEIPYNTKLPSNEPIDSEFISLFDPEFYSMVGVNCNNISCFDEGTYKLRGYYSFPKVNAFFNTLNKSTHDFYYQLLIDTRAIEASVFGINKVNQAILRYSTGNTALSLSTRINPLPNTKGSHAMSNLITGLGSSLTFAISMSFVPAGIVTFITKERETNAKHQQLISGLSLSAYWFSNFVIEYNKYLFCCILCPWLMDLIGASSVTAGDKLGALWMLFALYGSAITPFTYLSSFLFKEHSSAQTATFFINLGFGFIGGVAIAVLRLITSTRNFAKTIQWVFRVVPTFDLWIP